MIFKKIVSIIQNYTEIAPDEILKDSTFEELSLDDLDVVDLMMTIEDEFDVSIENTDQIKTVGNIVEYIEENI